MKFKILVTGAGGQLANEFIRMLENTTYEVRALSKDKLDISNLDAVLETISHYRPNIILNCAAYNLVDKAEEDFDSALKVNATGVKNLVTVSKKHNILLVHYSTDGVFDGEKESFYTERDEPNPINNYGRSKLMGERFVIEGLDTFLLLRVSWVFGIGKQNFLYRLMEWAKDKNVLKVSYDHISVPTYTEDIVKFTKLAVERGLRGIYNLTNSGYASRYELAHYFFEKLDRNIIVLPVPSDYFPSAAKRPYFTAMSNGKISKDLKVVIPHWRDSVTRFIKRLKFS